MKQAKFIYMIKNVGCTGDVYDDGNGVVNAVIRPGIVVRHDYKHADKISIEIKDTNDKYLIKNDSQLEDIIRMHLGNEHLSEILHEYCESNLEKVTT